MKLTDLMRRAGSSLAGNIVFAELVCALPFYLIFLRLIYAQGNLTFNWAITMALRVASIWAVFGILMWFTVSKPRLARRNSKRNGKVI